MTHDVTPKAMAPHQSAAVGIFSALARTGLPFAPLIAALALSLAYWPGLVTWDSLRQYGQALSGDFDDWHPPVMEWLWRQLLPLSHGPAPMLAMQLGLYGAGFGLLIRSTQKAGKTGRAFAIGCCALLPIPIALMGTVLKDGLMAGALLCAAGLTALATEGQVSKRPETVIRVTALLLCVFAATLRFNAFLAALPIAIWALPMPLRATPKRMMFSAVVLLSLLVAAMPVANRLVGARASSVELSLIIFDLGGITEYTHENQFPPLGLSDPVFINHRCYTPARWDSYSWWVDPCPIMFEGVRRSFHDHGINPRLFWISAILHHPLAYMTHRISHWNINARFMVSKEVERAVQVEAPDNIWGFAIKANAAVGFVDRSALASAHTPLGWPWAWMAALACLLWRGRAGRIDIMTQVFAWSGLLYGLGYGVLSVASDLRYYLWTMIAGAIAIALATPDPVNGAARLLKQLKLVRSRPAAGIVEPGS